MLTDEQVKVNVAANVARHLSERGWSRNELARRTQENQVTINNICNGKHVAGAAILSRIAEVLDVSMDRLVMPPPTRPEKISVA